MKNPSIHFTFTPQQHFHLTEAYLCELDVTRSVLVPNNYRTNFATIPAPARLLISPIDPVIVEAAVVHDYLTGEFGSTRGIIYKGAGETYTTYTPSWKESTYWMRTLMKRNGAPAWKRGAVYFFVRVFGVVNRLK